MPPTLAAVAIAKDEERDLPGLLANTLAFADEVVIVVDASSTDATAEIVGEAARRDPRVRPVLHTFDAATGFAGLRNAGIDAASADWLLHMDADMRVPRPLGIEIRHRIGLPDAPTAFEYGLLNHFLHRPVRDRNSRTWSKPWLARRGQHRFGRALHENVEFTVEAPTTERLREVMVHLNDEAYDERLRKSAQYSRMRAEAILDEGRPIRLRELVTRPLARAVRRYVRDGGWRDGAVGVVHALHCFDATFRSYALAWDAQNQIPRARLEDEIAAGWTEPLVAPPEPQPVTP